MKFISVSGIALHALSAIMVEAAGEGLRQSFPMTAAPDFNINRRQSSGDDNCSVGATACADGNGCCDIGSKCTSSKGVGLCADACDIGAIRCTFNGVKACCPLGSTCDYDASTPGACTSTKVFQGPPVETSSGYGDDDDDDDDSGSSGSNSGSNSGNSSGSNSGSNSGGNGDSDSDSGSGSNSGSNGGSNSGSENTKSAGDGDGDGKGAANGFSVAWISLGLALVLGVGAVAL